MWAFGDGDVVINQPYATHIWTEPGDYLVALWGFNQSNPDGVGATILIHVFTQPVMHVSATSSNPQPPYLSWSTAATNIADALNVWFPGVQLLLVSNGVYAGGLSVTKPLALLSVNGPQFTVIDGGSTNRCVWLADGASLTGFTLTNGAFPGWEGGGVWGGTLYNCTLSGNSADVGGAARGSTLYDCTLTGNSARVGGGASDCTLYNCSLSGNSAMSGGNGGGADSSTLYNCTVVGNAANYCGGVSSSALCNCIVYFNQAGSAANYDPADLNTVLNYCCTMPLPTNGVGNICADPQLASARHLSASSP